MDPKKSRYYTYIKPFVRNKSVRTYSSLVFTLITVSIFAVYAIRPTVITILSLEKSLEEQRGIAQTLRKKITDLSQSWANYERIDQDTKTKLNNLVPNHPSLPNVISALTALAQENEATISGIQIQPVDLEPIPQIPKKDATTQEVDLTFSYQGSYSQLVDLLNGLKRLSRLISLQSVTLNRQDSGNVIMTVNAKAIYMR
jgi:Tfp pilus assembly protein PilO